MEKVQFQLEATLPELKDLYEKGLFSKNEIDQITKRRTAFETSLIRRQTRKEDFFKYAEYEINLERLRKVRWRRLKYHLNPPPPSASTYSLPRRTSYILKRATVKFPGDLAVWLAYVEYASREGMRKVVLKGLNSALHHHPLSSTLYLLLSYHHLHPNSPFPGSSIPSTSKLDLPSVGDDDEDDEQAVPGFSLEGTASARTNILLGLRMIPKSHDLWREYIKLELGWVEGLRRRWQVLGVNIEPKAGVDVDPEALRGGEGSFGPEGEDARKSILSGQLALHAINSALTGIPPSDAMGMDFRQSLLDTLRVYPSALRTKCLEAVYDDLRRINGDAGKAVLANAKFGVMTKDLYDRPYDPERKDEGGVILAGEQLVDALGRIGKEIRSVAKRGEAGKEWLELSGSWLEQQIAACVENVDLRHYLFSILATLTRTAYNPPASLLVRHLNLLPESGATSDVIVQTARAHAAQYPGDPVLQLARFTLERSAKTDPETIRKAFKSAIKAINTSDLSTDEAAATRSMWISYLEWEEEQSLEDASRVDGIFRKALRDTLRQGTIEGLHDAILLRYLGLQVRDGRQKELLPALQQVASTYRPNHAFFADAFDLIADRAGNPHQDLRVVYRLWRAASGSNDRKVAATLHWAEWLLAHKHGKEAADAVDVMRREVGQDAASLSALDWGWAGALDEAERGNERDEGQVNEDEDVEMEGSDSEDLEGSDQES